MTDTLAPFESPKELIAGAKEQLAELERTCRAFGADCPYTIGSRDDRETGEKIVTLRLKNALPKRIRRVTSTILKEARLALDQAMCDGAILLGRKDAKNVYFPVAKDEAQLPFACAERCKNVDPRLVAYAAQFKPYYGGNTHIWALSRLAGKTHQRMIGARPQDQGAFAKAIVAAQGPLQIIINKWNSDYDELEVARLQSPSSSITVRPDFILSLEIIFSESAEQMAGRPVIATLNEMIGIAESIILGLEAETARLLKAGPV